MHIDVWVPHDQAEGRVAAAIAAGGRLVTDEHAPMTMTTATLTIVVIAVLIVGAIAWNVFGGKGDLERRRRERDPGGRG